MNFDLESRTEKFGENIIDFCKIIKQDVISKPLINQLVVLEQMLELTIVKLMEQVLKKILKQDICFQKGGSRNKTLVSNDCKIR